MSGEGRGICTRERRLISSAGIVLALLMLLPLKQTLSQRPSVSGDSARRDSMPTDSLRAADCAACFLAIPVGGVMILSAIFAAAPLALFIGERGPSEMSFLQDHGAASASVGGAFQAGQTWADAVRIEAVRRNLCYALTVEEFWRPTHVEYFTARAGYLFHPRRITAGGVTLGFMNGPSRTRDSGPEIGLPLFVGDTSRVSFRLEPTYVLSSRGLLWSHRAECDVAMPRQPYFLGVSAVGKIDPPPSPDTQRDFAHGAYLLTFGARF